MPTPSPLQCGVRVALLDADARLYSVEIYESGKEPHLVEIHDQDHAATLACEVIPLVVMGVAIRRFTGAGFHASYLLIVLCAAAMGAGVILLDGLLPLAGPVKLLLLVPSAAVAYVGLSLLVRVTSVGELKQLLKSW